MGSIEIAYRYEANPSSTRTRPMDAVEARRRLDEGSHAFAALLSDSGGEDRMSRHVINIDASHLGLSATSASAPDQRPYAAILGCSDARVPVELVFGEGPNDLFVVRVAGNALGDDVLGSLQYALDHLGSVKLVVVLGHSGCGAVTAAVDLVLEPAGYLALASQHVTRGLLDRLLMVVHASAARMAEAFGADVRTLPAYREALIEVAIVTNAALTAYSIEQQFRGRESSDIRAAYGVYLLASGEVWAPHMSGNPETGLAEPPRDAHGFSELSSAVLRSQRIASMLGRQT